MKVSSQVVDFSNNFLLLRKFRIEKITVTPPTCDCDEPLTVSVLQKSVTEKALSVSVPYVVQRR